ncbi:sensor histidine kinase [Paenibacillus sp. GCM10023252]|uniref:sensor histidine kinase n=1 Tax=Paenibacillus sp. GCM10023252 TaxID=3252649 RepID=UPI00361E0EF2
MRTFFTRMQYRHKLAAIILLFTLLPVIVLSTIYMYKSWKEQTEELLNTNRNQLRTGVEELNKLQATVTSNLQLVQQSTVVQSALSTNLYQDLSGFYTLNLYLRDMIQALENGNKSIKLYASKDLSYQGMYFSSDTLLSSELKSAVVSSESPLLIIKENDGLYFYGKINSWSEELAIVEYKVPYTVLSDSFSFNLPRGSIIHYVDHANVSHLIKENQPKSLDPAVLSSDDYYVIEMPLRWEKERIRMLIPSAAILSQLKADLFLSIGAVAGLALILILSVHFIAYQMTRRLYQLVVSMNMDVESIIQNPDEQLGRWQDEFSRIHRKFYSLAQSIRNHYERESQLEGQKKSLELQLLQERINPHFLYNTLSSLRWAFPDERLKQIIFSMVKYYRIALSRGHDRILISQELDMIREYLSLQRFAYDKDFDYDIRFTDDLLQLYIMKHLLQPAVENAFLHGIKSMKGKGGKIEVVGVRSNEKIIILVMDNGTGMEPEQLQAILEDQDDVASSGGYGIKNVRQRIQLVHGKDYGIQLESEMNVGTILTITIPVMER